MENTTTKTWAMSLNSWRAALKAALILLAEKVRELQERQEASVVKKTNKLQNYISFGIAIGCVIFTFKELRAVCQSREPWKKVRLRFYSVVAFYVTSFIAFKYYYPSLQIDTMVGLFEFLIISATSGEITEEEEEEEDELKENAEL